MVGGGWEVKRAQGGRMGLWLPLMGPEHVPVPQYRRWLGSLSTGPDCRLSVSQRSTRGLKGVNKFLHRSSIVSD
jgi:hypothetical protein